MHKIRKKYVSVNVCTPVFSKNRTQKALKFSESPIPKETQKCYIPPIKHTKTTNNNHCCTNCSSQKKNLDTLAQLRTGAKNEALNEEFMPLENRTKYGDNVTLQKRAKRKFLSHALSLSLVRYCDLNPEESDLKKSYWNTYYCAQKLAEDNGRITAEYCKNRWCLVCNSIRQMVLKNKYSETIESWKDKHFVTLTVPNCSAEDLDRTIKEMYKTFTKIKDMFYRRWRRGKGTKFVGLRKLECTYNPHRKDYHPHFHLIVNSEELAAELLEEWLKRNPTCDRKAQDLRVADNNSTKELFKYFTKVITTHDKDKRIYAHALNTIFRVIKGKRTFQPFGFKAKKIEKKDIQEEEEIVTEENTQNRAYPQLFMWNQTLADWLNKNTGELLSGHQLSESLREIADKKILLDSS